MTTLDIVLDLPEKLEREFFDGELHNRLAAVGSLRRLDAAKAARDRRLDADVLITGWGSARLPDHLDPSDRLRLIAHSAGTVRFLVPKTLIEDGVAVSQAASGMATSVAELALVFTISLLRKLQLATRSMDVERDWTAAASVPAGHTLAGSRIGVIGASRVGRAYIQLVKAAGAEVLVHDPYLSPEGARALGVELSELDPLLSSSRVVALHAPVTAETRGLLDARRLARIVDGGIFVNTARSAIVDTAALTRELISGRLSAAMDVFDEEPLPSDSRLWGLPNVILTPHIGGITLAAQRAMGSIVVGEVERFAKGEPLTFAVPAKDYDILA